MMLAARACATLVLVLLFVAGCGGTSGNGYGCTGRKCTATFDGPGSQDLSRELGAGARLELKSSNDKTATIASGGLTATLRLSYGTLFPKGMFILVSKLDGEKVTLSIERFGKEP